MRARVTKRDAAVLGVFLVVVVAVCVVLVKRQVSSTAPDSEAVVLASASPGPQTDTALVPTSGLPLGLGLIADPQAFKKQPDQPRAAAGRGGVAYGPRSTAAATSADGRSAGSESGPSGRGGPAGSFGGPSGLGGPAGQPQGGVVTVYIAALAGRGEDLSALMVQRDTGNTRWVPVGGSAFGYTLDYATLKGVILSRDGRQYVLELGEGRAESATSREAPKVAERTSSAPVETGPPDKTDAQRLLGTWSGSMQGMSMSVTFNAGGSGSMRIGGMPQAMSFTWSVLSPGRLQITVSFGGMTNTETSSYRFEGNNTLFMTGPGGVEIRLTR